MTTTTTQFADKIKRLSRLLLVFLFSSTCLSISPIKASAADLIWHVSALALGVASFGMGTSEENKYNKLAAEDRQLDEVYQNATSTEELQRIEKEHQENLDQLDKYKANITRYNLIVGVAVVWELYLAYSDYENRIAAIEREERDGLMPRVSLKPDFNDKTYSLKLSWNF